MKTKVKYIATTKADFWISKIHNDKINEFLNEISYANIISIDDSISSVSDTPIIITRITYSYE